LQSRPDFVFLVETRIGDPLVQGKGGTRSIDDDAAVDNLQPIGHAKAQPLSGCI